MDVPARKQDGATQDGEDLPSTTVTSHEPCPGKFVLTERDNTDGWIATDLVVDLER